MFSVCDQTSSQLLLQAIPYLFIKQTHLYLESVDIGIFESDAEQIIEVLVKESVIVTFDESWRTLGGFSKLLCQDDYFNDKIFLSVLSPDTLSVPRWSPQIPRRDLGNSIKHR